MAFEHFQPREGIDHSYCPLALVDRDAAGNWTPVSDCRQLLPALTQLVTLDLLGGDGQESLPGAPLPQPVRVSVRNGGLPIAGARVRFDTPGGHLATASAPTTAAPAILWLRRAGPDGKVVETDARLRDIVKPLDVIYVKEALF